MKLNKICSLGLMFCSFSTALAGESTDYLYKVTVDANIKKCIQESGKKFYGNEGEWRLALTLLQPISASATKEIVMESEEANHPLKEFDEDSVLSVTDLFFRSETAFVTMYEADSGVFGADDKVIMVGLPPISEEEAKLHYFDKTVGCFTIHYFKKKVPNIGCIAGSDCRARPVTSEQSTKLNEKFRSDAQRNAVPFVNKQKLAK